MALKITKICHKGNIALCKVIKIHGTGNFSLVEFGNLAPVVQKVDNAIQWIITIQRILQLLSLILIHWIVIYPVDSFI